VVTIAVAAFEQHNESMNEVVVGRRGIMHALDHRQIEGAM